MSGNSTPAREIRQVISILEDAEICCCLSGKSALIFYGAGRIRGDWEICVPRHRFDNAVSLIATEYREESPSEPQPYSLLHTFPRFKCSDTTTSFILVPSTDCCLPCEPQNICRSQNDLPYPTLAVFIQSLLESHNIADLSDAIDGSNISEEWGYKHLDLNNPVASNWVNTKNLGIADDFIRRGSKVPAGIFQIRPIPDRRSIWIALVNEKHGRLKFTQSPEVFATRFRLRNSNDPWLEERDGI